MSDKNKGTLGLPHNSVKAIVLFALVGGLIGLAAYGSKEAQTALVALTGMAVQSYFNRTKEDSK